MACVVGVQAVIEREQAREMLENMQRRFDDSVAETQQRIADECDLVRCEGHSARHQLEARVTVSHTDRSYFRNENES